MPDNKKPSRNRNAYMRPHFLLFPALVILTCLAGWAFAGNSGQATQPRQLIDRWVRPDGGYILELREFTDDGGVVAAYFNPNPVNVGRAGWRPAEQGLDLIVELRDVNYPGSTYALHYDPGTDSMQGIYFQALQKQSYQVIFIRSR